MRGDQELRREQPPRCGAGTRASTGGSNRAHRGCPMARNPASVFGSRIRVARCTQSTKPTAAPFAIRGALAAAHHGGRIRGRATRRRRDDQARHHRVGPTRTARTLLRLNQSDGFDCMGCAWPDPPPGERKTAEFCENGARALVRRGHRRRVRPCLHRGRPLCCRAALSSDGVVRMCAVATRVATFRPPDTKEAAPDFSETASDLLLVPVGMTGFEPAAP